MINLNIIKRRKLWLSISSVLVACSIIAIFSWGLNFGIDFTGGSLLEVKFKENNPSVVNVYDSLKDLGLSSLTVQPTESNSVILRFKNDNPEVYEAVMSRLNELAINLNSNNNELLEGEGLGNSTKPLNIVVDGSEVVLDDLLVEGVLSSDNNLSLVEELRFDSVGPSIGKELKSKSFNTIILVLVIIVLYVALVFRKVSKPVSSWKYGVAAIVALFHDVLIVLGVFAVLGKFYNVEINTPFIAAILTVLGYSVNDTIIVFDRIRENLPKSTENFVNTINRSINQTLVRSINTSFTTILVLLAIIFLGGASISEFVLALAIGIFVGTYSSIFIASPILIYFDKKRK